MGGVGGWERGDWDWCVKQDCFKSKKIIVLLFIITDNKNTSLNEESEIYSQCTSVHIYFTFAQIHTYTDGLHCTHAHSYVYVLART